MSDFTAISSRYEKDSVVQRSASEVLLGLAAIEPGERLLDLGCGTGHLTRKIGDITNAAVIGVDSSPGMVEAATKTYGGENLRFRLVPADKLDYESQFDVIFCNSVFQWFTAPAAPLARCHRALREGGRIAVQAPATGAYCPNFIKAVDAVAADPATGEIFSGFRSPWFFLETVAHYRALFEDTGFNVLNAWIEKVTTNHRVDEVLAIFESGAAAGYLNQNCNDFQLTPSYEQRFRKTVTDAFCRQANRHGMVKLDFHRIYLLAVKP